MSEQKFDKSKWKATKLVDTQNADKEVEAITARKTGGKNADYLDPKEGTGQHVYRVYPPHISDGGVLYAVPKGVHWIPQLVAKKNDKGEYEKDKDGNYIKNTWENRPIFNARIHGSQEQDLVEEYIKFANKLAVDLYGENPTDKENKDNKFKYLEPVKGSPFKKGEKAKHQGIFLKQTWVVYVDEIDEKTGNKVKFGRLEIGKSIKDSLNKIAASEGSNEPIGTDPFTDLDDCKAIKIIYNAKAEKAADYYSTQLYSPIIPGSGGRVKLFPLGEEDMIKFMEQTSLKKMFVNVYDMKTFDNVLNGLKYFDNKHELGVFEFDEWKDLVYKLKSKIADVETSNDEENGDLESGDQFDQMDRDELKDFIREFKLGIIPNKTMDDDTLRSEIRAALESKNALKTTASETKTVVEPDKIEKVEKSEPLEKQQPNDLPWDEKGNDIRKKEEEVPLETSQPKLSPKERLAALKNKPKA